MKNRHTFLLCALIFLFAGCRKDDKPRLAEPMMCDATAPKGATEVKFVRSEKSTGATIPVVFHVVWNQPLQNIGDSQIFSQLVVLNADYGATNADIGNVPAAFKSRVGNAGIRFAMAQRDPSGAATTGITRTYTAVPSFSSDGSVCYSSLGGVNAWPDSLYLNIWICNKTGAAGYSAYPWSGNPLTDGVIIGYNFVGTTGTFTNNWDYLLGRTLTHEVGHWLGLIHLWGDSTCGDDKVEDTPRQYIANGACPTFPHTTYCSPDSNGDMFMNYMDYTYDACRIMFSEGQVQRMWGYLTTTRAAILTSQGTVPPPCTGPVMSVTSITSTSALLHWTGSVSEIRYGKVGVPWLTYPTTGQSLQVTGLTKNTQYEFEVLSCKGWSAPGMFTTLKR